MTNLPEHGRVSCARCYQGCATVFDVTKRTEDEWRITCNPLSWGSQEPEIIVLGFSKGPTQSGALAESPHDEIAYKGNRLNVGKILRHIGVIPTENSEDLRRMVDDLISDQNGRFHFASLIRCTVERYDHSENAWKGTGGGMLDKFVSTSFGNEVATNCASQFLGKLPAKTKLIVMFGLGSKQGYVASAKKLFEKARSKNFSKINSVAYTDGEITVVHVEHFASQGALVPNWLGENNDERSTLGLMARDAVHLALGSSQRISATLPSTPARIEKSVVENKSTVAPALPGKVKVTAGNIQNDHIYLNKIIGMFPKEAIGGSNKASQAKQLLTVIYDGVGRTQTDIDGSKKFFRERSFVKQFFKTWKFKDGDEVLITRLGPYEFEVRKA